MSGRNLPRPAKSCAPQNAREAYCAESWLPLVEQLQTDFITLCKVSLRGFKGLLRSDAWSN